MDGTGGRGSYAGLQEALEQLAVAVFNAVDVPKVSEGGREGVRGREWGSEGGREEGINIPVQCNTSCQHIPLNTHLHTHLHTYLYTHPQYIILNTPFSIHPLTPSTFPLNEFNNNNGDDASAAATTTAGDDTDMGT